MVARRLAEVMKATTLVRLLSMHLHDSFGFF
jgi:hypothetical protein